jgi:hypothetical protein
MSLRIAWACHPRNIGLGIAANVFVYVGTIILFMIDWFFVQRIIRAQHQRVGWSTPYRIFHRGALGLLIACLIMIILANIWQFFTSSATKLHVFRALSLTGQTYFTVFCFAPAVLLFISALTPRHEVEKFGAGRLRINITILLIAVTVLLTGQLFRCVIAWIPQTPFVNVAGEPIAQPWYLHKACFYVFNFLTEIVVVIMFALVRVDLRFHVPNGSRMSGDYSGRNSRVNLNSTTTVNSNMNPSAMTSKKSLYDINSGVTLPLHHRNESNDTLHKYERSVFEDSNTLADSLRYGSSTLEVDSRTGEWKVKRASFTSTRSSVYTASTPARNSFNDRSVTFADDAPPVPEIPTEWPLSNSTTPHSTIYPPFRKGTPKKPFEFTDHHLNGVDVGDAITDALASLEHNSGKSEQSRRTLASQSSTIPANVVKDVHDPTGAPVAIENNTKSHKNPLAPRKRSSFPPKSALKPTRTHSNSNIAVSKTPTITEAPEVPQLPAHVAAPPLSHRYSTAEFITLAPRPTSDVRTIIDMSLQGDKASDFSNSFVKDTAAGPSNYMSAVSSLYSDKTTSSDAREAAVAIEEYKRFSYEAPPVVPGSDENIMNERRVDRRC